jgi:hypothetical protein
MSPAGEPALSASVSAPGCGKKNDRSNGWAARLTCRWEACPNRKWWDMPLLIKVRLRPASHEWLGAWRCPVPAVLRSGGGDALAADGAGNGDRAGLGQ